MAGFLYYLPGKMEGVTRQDVDNAGLGYAFQGTHFTPGGVREHGLDPGGRGAVVADSRWDSLIGLYPKKQTWRKVPNKDIWVGYYTDDPPGPADLARPNQLAGHPVTLQDGNDWLVPTIRQYEELGGELVWSPAVPRVSELTDDGQWVPGDIVAKFAAVWDTACRWQAELEAACFEDQDGDGLTVTFAEGHDAAAQMLGVNYVVSSVECALLKLFTMDLAGQVLNATVDWQTQIEWATKKNEEASVGEPSAAGPPDTCQTTDRP